MSIPTRRADYREDHKASHDRTQIVITFDAADAKGRKVGRRISTWRRVVYLRGILDISNYPSHAEEMQARELHKIQTPFAYCPHATRDGKAFGASQPTRYFATEDARADYISKDIAKSRKRAVGAYAKLLAKA